MRRRWSDRPTASCLLACLLAGTGCYEGARDFDGDFDSDGPPSDGSDSPPGAEDSDDVPGSTAAPGRLRRLTRYELDHVFEDLLDQPGVAMDGLDLDPQSGAFYNGYEDLWADRTFLQRYMVVAEQVAEQAVLDIDVIHPCEWAAEDMVDDCASGFLSSFGTRLFRRPLTDAEYTRYLTLFETTRSAYSTSEALHSLLHAMLLSPAFLYRDETRLGTADDAYQMASLLSFTLWSTTPDDELLAAAADDALRTPTQVHAQAERMLASPRARAGIGQFFEQLFDLPKYQRMEKDEAEHPDFSGPMVDAMKQELRDFVGYVVFEGEGTLRELLTAPYSVFDERLASIYGVTPSSDPSAPTPLPAEERAGLLTQPGFLAATAPASGTKPVTRGNFVLDRLLCIDLPPPPEDMLMLPPDVAEADLSTREKFELHIERLDCASCHQYLDPIGFGLEQYGGLGQFRTHEDDYEIDAQGELLGAGSQDGAFVGGRELAERLGASEVTRNCFARQFVRFALGRTPSADESLAIAALVPSPEAGELDVQRLLLDFISSPMFQSRAKR